MTSSDSVRALALDDLLALDLDALEKLSGLCDTAFAQRKKQLLDELAAAQAELEQQKRDLLVFEPKIREVFNSHPVKLNVGGTYFSTDLENLLKEPSTFFSNQFGGKWDPKLNPDDKALFIDRDPAMFGVILNYLRTGSIDLRDLSATQRNVLEDEVDYYQIGSLARLLDKAMFSAQVKGGHAATALTENRTVITGLIDNHGGGGGLFGHPQGGGFDFRPALTSAASAALVAISDTRFSSISRTKQVTIMSGSKIAIGIAPRSILETGSTYETCGWFVLVTGDGATQRLGGNQTEGFNGNAANGKWKDVEITLDVNFNVLFTVNGVQLGQAFSGIPRDASVDLHLVVCIHPQYSTGGQVKMVPVCSL